MGDVPTLEPPPPPPPAPFGGEGPPTDFGLPPASRPRRWIAVAVVIVLAGIATAVAIALASGGDDGSGASPSAIPSPSPVVMSPPVELEAKATPSRVVLTWSPADSDLVDGYDVLRDGGLVDTVGASDLRFVDKTVDPGTRYEYEVVTIGPDEARSDGVDVRVKTPVPPLAQARVEGIFDVKSTFTSKTGYGEYTAPSFGWRIRPTCPSGPCGFTVRDIIRNDFDPKFSRSGGKYEASFDAKFEIQCGGTSVTSTGTVLLNVVKASVIDGEWRATRLEGTLTHQEVAQLGCGFSKAVLAVTAKYYA